VDQPTDAAPDVAALPAEERAALIKLVGGDVAANERTLDDLKRMLILTRNNLVLGAVALFLGASAITFQPSVWPVGLFMIGLGGWTLLTALNKRTHAKREIAITEGKLRTSRLKLDSLMIKE
jgi:hypothetical protein